MLKTLAGKQGAYDKQALANDELAALQIRSLAGEDTRYAKAYKEKIQTFVDDSYGQDFASPEFQRKYRNIVKEYKNDEGLKSIANAVSTHDKYLERREELIKKGEIAAADEMANNYNRRFKVYTAEDGLGYKGDVSLGDPLVGEGVDRFKENLKFFEPMKDSGSESAGFLADGISYKNGWEGISDQRVKVQADRMFNDWATSAGGLQTAELYNMQHGIGDYEISKLAPDKKEEYKKNLDNFLKNEFLEVGRTIVHGKSTTNIDQAYNKQNDRKYEELDNQNIITGQLEGIKIPFDNKTWEAQTEDIDNKVEDINKQIWEASQNPNRFAPGTVESLKRRRQEELSKKTEIKKDRDQKYSLLSNQIDKEYSKYTLNNIEGSGKMGAMMISKYRNYFDVDAQGNVKINDVGQQAIKQDKDLALVLNSSVYGNYSEDDKKALAYNFAKPKLVNSRFKETYYDNRGSGNAQFMGVITTPTTKGSTSNVEEKMINEVRSNLQETSLGGKLFGLI